MRVTTVPLLRRTILRLTMAQAKLPPDEDNARFEREVDELLSNANPNPARTGCLTRAALSKLAQRATSLDDPRWQHLLSCSPCYREFLALREEYTRITLSRPAELREKVDTDH
jgi:hypothetical protein